MRWLINMAVCLLAVSSAALAKSGRSDQALQISRSALGQMLPDLAFTKTDGQTVHLKDFRGKPLLITLVYTACADVCPTLIENLAPAVKEAQRTLGRDSFAVLTIGFDVRKDTPERMRLFARTRGVNLPNWHFLAADKANLDALAKAVGFAIYSRAGGFDHLAQVSIIDGSGKLYQQVYGAIFAPPLIVEPLKDLLYGRNTTPAFSLTRLVDRIKLFCTVYDPNSGRYYFNYALFIGIAIGGACLTLVLTVLIREWRRAAPGPGGFGG